MGFYPPITVGLVVLNRDWIVGLGHTALAKNVLEKLRFGPDCAAHVHFEAAKRQALTYILTMKGWLAYG